MSPLFVAVRRAALLCVPFATLFTVGIALSPHADAQYPGGGGNPGGGGGNGGGGGGTSLFPAGDTYPGASPGWYPLHTDGTRGTDTLGPAMFSGYDWTPLDEVKSYTDPTGVHPSNIKYHPNNASSIDLVDLSPVSHVTVSGIQISGGAAGGGGGNPNGGAGQSTIKFLWLPPNTAAGQPDLTNFPTPPLFALGIINASASLSLSAGHAHGQGQMCDGWTPAPAPFTLPSATAFMTRKVLTATQDDSAIHWKFLFSPWGYAQIKADSPDASAGGSINLSPAVYPITLSLPGLFCRPDLGDGKNQFVYDTTVPSGQLILPSTIGVFGASPDDTAWLMRGDQNSPDVNIALDLPTETKPINSSLRDHTISSVVPVDQIMAEHGPLNAPVDGFLFAGLPTHNSDFGGGRTPGYHTEKLTVNSNVSETAYIQTFFTGVDGSGNYTANYPNAATNKAPDGSVIPNWYYYYSQVYSLNPTQGSYDKVLPASSHISLTPPFTAHIHDDVYGTYTIPVFCLSKPIQQNEFVKCLGTLAISGLHSYVFITAHEAGHQVLSQQGVYNWNPMDANGNFTQPLTTDGDHVVDTWEQSHHMKWKASDVNPANTTGYNYSNTDDVADDEIIADIQGLGVLFSHISDWSKDWANPGIQWGGGHALYFNPQPVGTQEGFYLTFTPSDTAQSSFHVHNLNDLTTHYPNNTILTDVSQMVGP